MSDKFSHEEMADDRVKLMWGRRIISDVGITFICLSLPVPPLVASGNPHQGQVHLLATTPLPTLPYMPLLAINIHPIELNRTTSQYYYCQITF